jgi:hypothetical protein
MRYIPWSDPLIKTFMAEPASNVWRVWPGLMDRLICKGVVGWHLVRSELVDVFPICGGSLPRLSIVALEEQPINGLQNIFIVGGKSSISVCSR